jgi:hypothetical protein
MPTVKVATSVSPVRTKKKKTFSFMCDYISQGAFLYFTDDIFGVIKLIQEYFNI